MKKRTPFLKSAALFVAAVMLSFQAHAAVLSELWSSGTVNGMVFGIGNYDVDSDGVNDIISVQHTGSSALPGLLNVSFKAVRGEAFTDLYDWVTPPGDYTEYGGTMDIDQNSTYEIIIFSISAGAENTYEAKILIYDAQTGEELPGSGSPAFEIASGSPPVYPFFSGFPLDVTGTDAPEWIVSVNTADPVTGEKTGRVMVYARAAAGPGISRLLWEQSFAGGYVFASFYSGFYDLDDDGKVNLAMQFSPDNEAQNPGAGAIIFFTPSGTSGFSELERFEAGMSGNDLALLYSQRSTHQSHPTKVDHGMTSGNLIFVESWTEQEQKKNILYAYAAEPPYAEVGQAKIDGGSLGVYLGDFNGDGWDEVVIDSYDADAEASNVSVYSAEGGSFTLTRMWETGTQSGKYYADTNWDINRDTRAELGLMWQPPAGQTTTKPTYTFYGLAGSTFSLLHQFTSRYTGSNATMTPVLTGREITGPAEKLTAPVDLDCTAGNDLAFAEQTVTYAFGAHSYQIQQKARAAIYNLSGKLPPLSWSSDEINASVLAGDVVTVREMASHDLLLYYYTAEISGASFNSAGAVEVLSCGEATSVNSAPAAPGSPVPADKRTKQPLRPALQWTCADEDKDALTYDVLLDTENPPAQIAASGQAAASFTPSEDLRKDTTYYWQVIASDGESRTKGPVWSFTTGREAEPSGECTLTRITPDSAEANSFIAIAIIFAENSSFEQGKTKVDFGTDTIQPWIDPVVIRNNIMIVIMSIDKNTNKADYAVTVTTGDSVCSGVTLTIK